MSGLRTVRGVELARVGSWDCSTGPWTCTPEHIASAVLAGADVSLSRAVVKLGHTDPRFDGSPAFGQVSNLRASADGQVLLGDLVNVPGWLADSMSSAYPHRSVEGLHDVVTASGVRYPFALTGLALLGATAPAVPGLAPVPASYDVAAAHGARSGTAVALRPSRSGVVMAGTKGATPLVRQIAAAQGVDVEKLTGTGVAGRVTKADVLVQAAVQSGRIIEAERAPWLTYMKGLSGEPLARAELSLMQAPSVAATTPAAPQTPATQVLPVGPTNAAETAAVLGPRPGSDWFAGVPPVSAQAQAEQAQWDAKVSAAMTYEEHLAREVAFEAQRRGITEAQARNELEGVRDTGIRS